MNTIQQHSWYNVNWFKRMAPIYDYVEFLVAPLRRKVAKKIRKSSANVLDVACGTGNQSIAFAKNGFSVVGIDLSPDMLKFANNKIKSSYDIQFICKDAIKIPYPNGAFDVSSMSFGLHDMPKEIGISILKEMMRTTKKNGKIILVDYHKPHNRLNAWIKHRIVKLWESKYYDGFMKVGVQHYLKKVGLKPIHKETYLLGNIQIMECKTRGVK